MFTNVLFWFAQKKKGIISQPNSDFIFLVVAVVVVAICSSLPGIFHAITTMMFCDDIFIADIKNTTLERDMIYKMARAYHSNVNSHAEM